MKKRKLKHFDETDITWCLAGRYGKADQCKRCRRNRVRFDFDWLYSCYGDSEQMLELAKDGVCPRFMED